MCLCPPLNLLAPFIAKWPEKLLAKKERDEEPFFHLG